MEIRRAVLGTVVAVAATAALVLPARGTAATTVGLSFTPTLGCASGAHTYYGQKTTAPDPYVIPAAGVITSWTLPTAGTGFTAIKLKVGTSSTSRIVRTDAESESVTLLPNSATPNPVRIPVVAGQRVGFYTHSSSPCYTTGSAGMGVDDSLVDLSGTTPDEAPGTTHTYTPVGAWSFPLSVRVEPDADNDGYGDETQDACPTVIGPGPCPAPPTIPTPTPIDPAPAPTPPPAPDRTRPILRRLGLSHTSFKASTGAKLSFSLSEAAKVTVTAERRSTGRRVGHTCKKQTAKNKRRKPCDRWAKVGSFVVAGATGKNTVALPRHIGGKRLTPGAYRLSVRATDTSKNVGATTRKRFKIVT